MTTPNVVGAPLTPQEIEELKAAHARGLTPATALLHAQLQSLSLEDRQLCMLIASRGCAMYQDMAAKGVALGFSVDPVVIGLDVAVAHLCRTLDLRKFLRADDFAFAEELGTIIRYVDRTLAIIPPLVKLRFAIRT